MARPLSLNSLLPRNGSPNALPSQTARLALAAEPHDESAAPAAAWEDEPAAAAESPDEREHAAVRVQLAETERLLADLRQEAEAALQQQQTEFERILEEKSELIRELHGKVQEFQERPARPVVLPREEELMALSEELERDRKQLKDDEASLMEQMGQMEVQMSRERASCAAADRAAAPPTRNPP